MDDRHPRSPGLQSPPAHLLNNPRVYSAIPPTETVEVFLEAGFSLVVCCRACKRLVEMPPPMLAERFAGKFDTNIADIQRRLVCRGNEGCGSSDVVVYPHLYEHPWTWAPVG